ncbi:hypothetical protein GB881_05160, partial [Georgenia subflava]
MTPRALFSRGGTARRQVATVKDRIRPGHGDPVVPDAPAPGAAFGGGGRGPGTRPARPRPVSP